MSLKIVKFAAILSMAIVFMSCKKSSSDQPTPEPPENIQSTYITEKDGDYFVSPNGSDDASGTEDAPWKTIQKGVNSLNPGDVLIVKAGTYNEVVEVKKGGSGEDNKIEIVSEQPNAAKCLGFEIEANYVSVQWFEISSGSDNWTGIFATGIDYIDILGCYIHDCPLGGIWLRNNSDNARVIANVMKYNGNWGATVVGSNCLIESNEVHETVQYHPKGLPNDWTGSDADGFRFYGINFIIRNNKVINIGDPNDKGNVDPHVDAIQCWDGGASAPLFSNSLIEGNFFSTSHASGKGLLVDASNGNAAYNITIRNNIFEYRDIGIAMYEGAYRDIFIYNNVFKANVGDKSWGTSMYLSNVSNYNVINNITIDCHPEHRKIKGGSGIVDYNIAWNTDGEEPRLEPSLQANEQIINPEFVSYTGVQGVNDYHLLSVSPAIDAGKTIEGVGIDHENTPRPQGAAFDIGAYEYK